MSGGTLTQLVALGAENQYLTGSESTISSIQTIALNQSNPSHEPIYYECQNNLCVAVDTNDLETSSHHLYFNSFDDCQRFCQK